MAVELIFLVVITLLQFCGVMYMVCCYVKLKRTLDVFLQFAVQTLTTMDCDDLLATLLAEPDDDGVERRLAHNWKNAKIWLQNKHCNVSARGSQH